nr:nuclear transport factor 2 family protein [Kineococcus siccus]
MLTYLQLCDVPAGHAPGVGLRELFTPDAVWEGVGADYGQEFGRHEGREAVLRVLARYLPPSPHFRANVHLLSPGLVEVTGPDTARGSWTMQQFARYDDGSADVRLARLDVGFVLPAGGEPARISSFRTRGMFAHPLAAESTAVGGDRVR